MKHWILSTNEEWTGLILRFAAGSIMFTHGAQKMLGWFGGYGFRNSMTFFTETMKLPHAVAWLVIVLEFVGSILLIAGFATRVWALAFVVIMVGAMVLVNAQHGFFMNWFGTQRGEGVEYHVLMIALCLSLILTGSGRFSIDGLLSE
jgi:putative oxidoreductase